MPHLTIEYSANLADGHDIDGLVAVVHEAALEHGLASVEALRTRAVEHTLYRVADGSPDLAFVAITARIGPGRTDEAKRSFITHVLDRACDQVEGESPEPAVAWSMEIQEIDPKYRLNRNRVRHRLKTRTNRVPTPPSTTTT